MPQNDLKTLPHNQKSTTHKKSRRLGYDFLANQSSKQIFFDKKKETFRWTESRNAKDQEIEPQQSKYLQDAQETKETMPKTRKKIHWGNEKNCRKAELQKLLIWWSL